MHSAVQFTFISVFGRGHWLAGELAEMGHSVTLVDLTPQMGRWAPEDWEGPFGFFHSDRLSATQIERLAEEDYQEPVDEGFAVWLKDGPFDVKGPLSSYWLSQLGIEGDLKNYLSGFVNLGKDEKKKLSEKLLEMPYDKLWFAHLLSNMGSTVYYENHESVQKGQPLPVFSPLYVRRVSRRGFEKSLSWCESKGVRVLRNAEILDVLVESSKIDAIEFKGEQGGVLKSNHFVWLLTSEEIHRLPTVVSGVLCPQGSLESEWCWVRYRYQINELQTSGNLPLKFLVINDIYLPWTHSNAFWVQKTVQENLFDVWTRIPTHHRFQKEYLNKISTSILQTLADRIPHAEVELLDMPQDYHYESSELGPPRFPIYNEAKKAKFKMVKLSNVSFDSPETWINLDWCGQFESQAKLKNKLLSGLGEKN